MIRIQLGAMDTMLADIVTAVLAREPDIEVIGRATTASQALRLARARQADVLLLQDSHDSEIDIAAARFNDPRAILSIAANGREGWIVRLDAERRSIDAAHGGLAAVVRLAAQRRGQSPAQGAPGP